MGSDGNIINYVKMEGKIDGKIKDKFKIWIWRYIAGIISDVGRCIVSEVII